MSSRGSGLVELHDDKESNRGFFCLQLVTYLGEEAEPGTERYGDLWPERFAEAKAGRCAYRDKCPIYARTIAKHPPKPQQPSLFPDL